MEKWVLANLSHPSIIRIYQTFQDRAAMYLVLEHVPGGELWALSHGRGVRPSLASFYVAQVAVVVVAGCCCGRGVRPSLASSYVAQV